jgi:hypothetical protein
MPRRDALATPILPVLDIKADGIYRPAQIQQALGLGASALRGEWRGGRLRIIRRCNKNFLLGKDILNWMDSGELPSPAKRFHTNGAAV